MNMYYEPKRTATIAAAMQKTTPIKWEYIFYPKRSDTSEQEGYFRSNEEVQ
jgi:penicillin-binding protein-related factor A (putative recombinase)